MREWVDTWIVMLLTWISIEDQKKTEIPNRGIAALLVPGIVYVWEHPSERWELLAGFFCFGGLLLGLYFLSGGGIIGAGDIKLLAVCGLRLGFDGIAKAFLLGASLGMIVQIIRRKFFRGETYFPMGPWLSFGIIWMLFQ